MGQGPAPGRAQLQGRAMSAAFLIPAALYDGLLHRVPYEVGADFAAKWAALREDGFTVAIDPGAILACKILPGAAIPALA